MMRALRWALGACAVTLAGSAHAQTGQVELIWLAPDGCPSGATVRRSVERTLNRSLSVEDGERLVIRATVTPADEPSPWSVLIETDNGQRRARRSFEAASCQELANATALFVAILLKPQIDDPPIDDPTAEKPPAGMQAETMPVNTASPSPAEAQAADTIPSGGPPAEAGTDAQSVSRWAIGGTGGVRSGLVPDWTFGLGLHGAFSWKALHSVAGASFWLPVRKTLESGEAQGAELQLSSVYIELCLGLDLPALMPAVCSGAELSALRGRGFGSGVEPEARTAAFAALSVGGKVVLRSSGRLSWLLDIDGVLPLGERQFVLTGRDPAVIYAPSAGVRLSFGAQWSL